MVDLGGVHRFSFRSGACSHDRIGSQLTRLVIGEIPPDVPPPSQSATPEIRRTALLARQALRDLDEVVWLTDPRKDTLQRRTCANA